MMGRAQSLRVMVSRFPWHARKEDGDTDDGSSQRSDSGDDRLYYIGDQSKYNFLEWHSKSELIKSQLATRDDVKKFEKS